MIWYVRSHLGGIKPSGLPQKSHLILKVQSSHLVLNVHTSSGRMVIIRRLSGQL